MYLSPLTEQETEAVPNTPYVKDHLNFWVKPSVQQSPPSVFAHDPAPVSELKACGALADSLKSYLTENSIVGTLYQNPALSAAFLERKHDVKMLSHDYSLPTGCFDFICSVHEFQKLTVPAAEAFLIRAAQSLKPSGHLFIRMPDNEVDGYERDLKQENQNTCFWNLYAFLELLSRVKFLRIVETKEIKPGQRDYILKVFPEAPKVCAGLIVKNEERDLPKCLDSLRGMIDGLVVVDTGSSDRTMEIARQLSPVPDCTSVTQYLGASEPNPKDPTDYQLWDFGKARNRYLDIIEEGFDGKQFDYVLWMDADDILKHPKLLRNLTYLWNADVHGIQMVSGTLKWVHHRLWKNKKSVRYRGACHEYPQFNGLTTLVHRNIEVHHDCSAGAGESSNARNLRILKREALSEPTPRNAFYLANTYREGGDYQEAIVWYEKRKQFGKGFEDEYWFATLYQARCLIWTKQYREAERLLLGALAEKPDWAEFWMELAYMEYSLKQYRKGLAYSMMVHHAPIPHTTLFRERNRYTDQPFRISSFCAEALGLHGLALEYAEEALNYVPEDRDLQKRVASLKIKAPTFRKIQKKVSWLRPGAIGDVLMTLNLIRAFRRENPDTHITYQCHPTISRHLHDIIIAAGADEVFDCDKPFAADHTYRLMGYPLQEGYPNVPMRDHLLRYFAKDLGVRDLSDQNLFDSFRLPEPLRQIKERYCTVHVQAGWSPYKNWPVERWEIICEELRKHIKVIQIGGPDDVRLKSVDDWWTGKTFNKNLNLFAHSDFHLGIDSWSNHASNIIWNKGKTKSVILWGSTQASAAGYDHNRNISVGLACQPCFKEDPKISGHDRGVCPNPPGQTYKKPLHQCMQDISVENVMETLLTLLA